MELYRKRKWFNFQDVDVFIYNDLQIQLPEWENDSDTQTLYSWLKNVLDDLEIWYDTTLINSSITDATQKGIFYSLVNMVIFRHYNDYCIIKVGGVNETLSLNINDVRKFFNKIINIFNLTAPRYMPLFIENTKAQANPIPQLSSSSGSVVRFNDTPQDTGTFDDDKHTTHLTESESSSSADITSLMARLNEVYTNFHSIINDWSDEFNKIFYKEEQIDDEERYY